MIRRRQFLSLAGGTAVAAMAGASEVKAAEGRSNDETRLTPHTQVEGPSLSFDFPAMEIGVAEYPEGPTGCTVLHFPKGASAAMDVRGGMPGTIWTDLLREGDGFLHAICFAGGSLYGLEAATGVSAELLTRAGYSTKWDDIALVSGAIVDRKGQVVRGHLDPRTGQRAHITDLPLLKQPPKGNTCLTAVVTNQKLDAASLRQLARQVHSSMSRAIEPFHTPVDGDVLYAVSTHEVAGSVNQFVLAAAASELAWDAVLASCAMHP
jgi:L-aminopeptidase/D-esterase-like protein